MIRKVSLLALFALATVSQAQDDLDKAVGDGLEEADAVAKFAVEDATEAEEDVVAAAPEAKSAVATSEGDFLPGFDGDLWIGITSCVGVVWWMVWGMFLYIRTNDADATMSVNNWTSGLAE